MSQNKLAKDLEQSLKAISLTPFSPTLEPLIKKPLKILLIRFAAKELF